MTLRTSLYSSIVLLTLASSAGATIRDDQYFEVSELPSAGRSVGAELADVNGDGLRDLFIFTLSGIPPREQRVIHVYLQKPGQGFRKQPDFRRMMPRWSAVYDVADVRQESPGEELLLLRPDGVTILSLASAQAPSWDLKAPGPSTLGVADDERGLEPYPLVYDDFGDEPWILVPQIGQLTALSVDGRVKAQLEVPRRANYFVMPQNGLLALESAFQLYIDAPKLIVGDINGDGRADIASATRHELKVFLRRRDGSFPKAADRDIALGLVTPRDHIRGSGGVTTEAGDIDGDGDLDLLVSHVAGGFTDATTTLHVYLSKNGGWNIEAPDETMVEKSTLSSSSLFDITANGKLELMRIEFRFGIMEVIETLLSRSVDLTLSTFRYRGLGKFSDKALQKKKFELPIDFDTFRPSGFMPSAEQDVNGDGFLDFVTSGNGKKMLIYPGTEEGPFKSRPLRQAMPTAGVIHFADWSGDGLPDFVLFDPHNFDVPIRLGRNLGPW